MSDPFHNQVPPHDRDAERGVIGGVLRDPDVLPSVRERVGAESFYFDAHQKLFQSLCDLAAEKVPLDLVMLHERLRREKWIEDVGGAAYLAELWEAVPTGANAEYHAGLVRETAVVRGLIHAGNEILRDAYDRVQSGDDLVAAAARKIANVVEQIGVGKTSLRHVGDVLRDALQRIDDRITAGGGMNGLSTGYPDLDEVVAGLKRGELTIVGARPGGGKTSLGLNLAMRVASTIPTGTAFYSLEMPEDSIAGRLISIASGVPMHKVNRGLRLSETEVDDMTRVASPHGLGGRPLYIDSTPNQSVTSIMGSLVRAVRKFDIGFAVVDYLQIMRPDNPKDNRTQQVDQIARGLKNIARVCNIPVMALCQLNREVEGRPDKKPRLSDLKESGGIEQEADVVILLSWQPNQSPDSETWLQNADVAKNRNGPVGEVTLAYQRPVMRFESAAVGSRYGVDQ